jgi:uncharacterized protein (TIGR03437 family)
MKADAGGNLTTFAGTNQPGFGGDGGPATAAMLAGPRGVGVDSAGNVYVADSGNNVIRKINAQGIISTIAGIAGKYGYSGDGGKATEAMLFQPSTVSPDAMGNLYIDDGLNYRIRVVNSEGVISTAAGGGGSLQNGPPSGAAIAGAGIQVDGSDNILVAEPGYRVVRRVVPHQSITTVAGVLPTAAAGDGLQATSISLLQPVGVGVNGGNVYITDTLDNRLRKVSSVGIITTVAGNGIPGGGGNGGPASQAGLNGPLDFGFDPAGDLYLSTGLVIREITASGTIMAFAGTGPGYGGDGGPATQAELYGPADAVGDSNGNVYISDKVNNLIRKVNSSGVISTYAGNAATRAAGFAGDGGLATEAELSTPYQLALDSSDNLYIADYGNSRVRKITPDDIISTVAGGGPGPLGDGGPATSASVGGNLTGVAVDAAGNLYIATNARIRKVDAATGNISTIAGTETAGFSGDGGLATLAMINGAASIAVDGSGNVYFSDVANLRVRMLTPVQIVQEGVLNGATFQAGGVAPGEIVTIYGGPGVTLGPASALGIQLDAAGRVSTSVGGTQVMFGSVAAPLIYVSSGQINAIVPYEVAGAASTVLQVSVKGQLTNTVTLPVVSTSPGIFAITNQNGSVNSAANPVAAAGTLVLYGTGEGQTSPAGVDGGVNTKVFPKPVAPVSATIGGQPAKIIYAGAAPDFVAGVLQVDVQVPAGVTGTVPLVLTIGDASTPAGTMVTVQ